VFDIITFGSATRDMFLKSGEFKAVAQKKFITEQGLCISLGSKIPVEDLEFATGGGGTNPAATFALHGFKIAYCGKVGGDMGGRAIIEELENLGINTKLVVRDKNCKTNYSVVLSVPGKERTILVYRDASEKLIPAEIPWKKLKTKWFYVSPLSGKLVKIFNPLISFARKNNIKVFLNPGNTQLSLPKKVWLPILKTIDILMLNQEEAALLSGIPYKKEKEIFERLDGWTKGIVVMTRGPFGPVVSDGKFRYSAGCLKERKLIDRTGAGDAFGSGFLTGFIKSKGDIAYAIQFGSANATGCIEKFGAKSGILKKGESIYQRGHLQIERGKVKSKK